MTFIMARLDRDYPVSAEEYELLEEAGRGVSATVSIHGVLLLCMCKVKQAKPIAYHCRCGKQGAKLQERM